MIYSAAGNFATTACPSCGHIDDTNAKFCGGCGSPRMPAMGATYGQQSQQPAALNMAPPGQIRAQVTSPQQQALSAQQQQALSAYQQQQAFAAKQAQSAQQLPQPAQFQYQQQPFIQPPYGAPTASLPEHFTVPNSYVPPPRPENFSLPPQHQYHQQHQHHQHAITLNGTAAVTEVLPAGLPGNPRRPVIPLNDRNVPVFAHVQTNVTPDVSNELRKEAARIMVLMARERLFLYFHWLLFLVLNVAGCWLALKCYHEFIGDEMSKIMIACTPFLFINSVALCCIVPIRGTRREIARLKERSQYVKFKMEFGHLM